MTARSGALALVVFVASALLVTAVRTHEQGARPHSEDLGFRNPQLLDPPSLAFSAREASDFRALWEARPDAETRPAKNSIPVAHQRTGYRDGIWSVTTYRNEAGELCGGEQIPSEGQFLTCFDPQELFRETPMTLEVGSRQNEGTSDRSNWDLVWLWGLTASSVHAIRLVLSDCRVVGIPLDTSGIFLHLVTEQDLRRRVWPYEVTALGASGQVIARRKVRLSPPETASGSALPRKMSRCP